MTTKARAFLSDQSGAVAVEFALILPILALFLLGILSFGYLFGVSHSLQMIAAEAARSSIRGASEAERIALANAMLSTAAQNYALIDPSKVTGLVQRTTQPLDGVRVSVTYDLTGSLADILPQLWDSTPGALQREAYLAW